MQQQFFIRTPEPHIDPCWAVMPPDMELVYQEYTIVQYHTSQQGKLGPSSVYVEGDMILWLQVAHGPSAEVNADHIQLLRCGVNRVIYETANVS